MKKWLAILIAEVLAIGVIGCNTETKKDSYTVGICQIAQHPALDAATQGFIDAINAELPGKVTFDNQNASGETANCATIVNGFVSKKVDLIMANATAPLQAAASATDTIPILGTSVTAYNVALDIDNFNGTVGGNISGCSDLASLDDVAKMIQEWFPADKYPKVGYLFCSAEPNSRYQIDELDKRLKAAGYESTEYAFADSNDIASVTEKATQEVDFIYIPTDNTAASNTETIANVTIPKKFPVVAGEEGICKGLGLCTLSISYYDLGYATGKMAVEVLTGKKNISEMPIGYADAAKKYEPDVCKEFGIEPPEGYTAIEK